MLLFRQLYFTRIFFLIRKMLFRSKISDLGSTEHYSTCLPIRDSFDLKIKSWLNSPPPWSHHRGTIAIQQLSKYLKTNPGFSALQSSPRSQRRMRRSPMTDVPVNSPKDFNGLEHLNLRSALVVPNYQNLELVMPITLRLLLQIYLPGPYKLFISPYIW